MIKVYITEDPCGLMTKIFIVDEQPGRRFLVAKPVELVFEEKGRSDYTEATMSLSHEYAQDFLKSFAEVLDKKGIKTENDNKLLGILEAKKDHLEDMRKLVFKDK